MLMLTGRKSQKWLVLFCLLSCGVRRSSQLFRFCHRGVWHQLLEEDCPYGMLFNEQLRTPCYYTAGTGTSIENVMRIWPSLCGEPYLNKGKVSDGTNGDGTLVGRMSAQISLIEFDDDSEFEDSNKARNYDDQISLKTCEDRCYRDVFEEPSAPYMGYSSHEASDSLEGSHHVFHPNNKLSTNEITAFRDQTLRLGDYLFDQIPSPDENPGPKLRIAHLFKRSIEIMGKTCQHPFIPSNFVNRVLYGFLFLVSDSFGVAELEDVSVEEFDEITMALNGCDEKSPDFRLRGTICDTNAIVKEVIKIFPNGSEITAPFLPTSQHRSKHGKKPSSTTGGGEGELHPASNPVQKPSSFPYDKLDIFTEAAWAAVQVTHATCFSSFNRNANMLHRYVSAMEQLFSRKIQDRWRNPTPLIDNEMWGTWFLADVDLTFMNLQACIRAAYLNTPFVMKLDRPIDLVPSSPSLPKRALSSHGGGKNKRKVKDELARRKRQLSDVDEPFQHHQSDSYWDTYATTGGIRYKLSDEIQCFETLEDKEKAVSLLKEQCKTGSKQ